MKLKNSTIVFLMLMTFHMVPTREPIADIHRQQNPLQQPLLDESFTGYESTRSSNQSTRTPTTSPSIGPSNASITLEPYRLDAQIPAQHVTVTIPQIEQRRQEAHDRNALNRFCQKFACCAIPPLLLGVALTVLHKTHMLGM